MAGMEAGDLEEQIEADSYFQERTTPDSGQGQRSSIHGNSIPQSVAMYSDLKTEKAENNKLMTPQMQKSESNIEMMQNFAPQTEYDITQGNNGNLVLQINNMAAGGECDSILSPSAVPATSNTAVVSTTPVIQLDSLVETDGKMGNAGSPSIFAAPAAVGQPCMICGDKGSGYHYSVFSCEGCKGFFKRSVQKNLVYSCKNDGECSINKFTRNNCQYCRFVKCSQMGMKREAVREDRSPGGKHRHKRPKLDEVKAMVGPEGNVVFLPPSQESDIFDDKIVEGLVAARPDLIPRVDGNIGLQNMGINQLMQYGYAELKYIIDWAKKVPGFHELCIEDQMALLKSSFMELNVLRLSYRSQEMENTIMFAEGLKVPVDLAQRMGWGKELINATIEFAQRLKVLHIDKTEFCVLNGIVLTYPDAAGLKEKHRVTLLQTQILNALGKYQHFKYPNNPKRYGQTLLRLPSLRTVSAKAAERFLSLTLDGTVQINDLVLEMIN